MIRAAHLSDLHIRNFKRHREYRASLALLYASLRDKKPDIIIVTGDICHTKSQISPEFVQLSSEYFIELSNIAPLVVIPGNHDAVLSNTDRLDSLTPVIDAINEGPPREHGKIHYYKPSGIYDYNIKDHELSFAVFSCLDQDWPTEKDVNKEKIIIGLYHGFVKEAELQNGLVIEEAPAIKDFLTVADYLMMGDIHKMQIMDGTYKAAYCGSYPQQNYGEGLKKGYLLWDIESKDEHEVDFVELPNVCPYYTIKLDESLVVPGNLGLQSQARIRVLSKQMTVAEKQETKQTVRDLYNPIELRVLDDISAHRQEIRIGSVNTRVEYLGDLAVQEKLLRLFLKQYDLSEELLSQIIDINKSYNAHVRKSDDTLRNIQYRFGKLSWSNTFSYGEDNEFDFARYPGLVGIVGKNGTGKSSLAVDIPLYCIFGRISKRVTKNDLIINENKEFCSAEFEVFVGKEIHRIKRDTFVYLKSGKKQGKPVYQGRTEVDYKVQMADGSIEDRNGEERSVTDNEYIRKTFGTVEDFISTSVSPQWHLLDFIEKGPTERLRLIGRYFDVDIFEKKYDLAKKQMKNTLAQMKVYDKKDLANLIKENETKSTIFGNELQEGRESKKFQEDSLKRLSESIEQIKSEISNVKEIGETTEKEIGDLIRQAKLKAVTKRKEIRTLQKQNEKNEKESAKLREQIKSFDREGLESTLEEYNTLVASCDDCDRWILEEHDNMTRLEKYPCAVNLDCCMRQELEETQKKLRGIASDFANYIKKRDKIDIKQVKKDIKQHNKLQKSIQNLPNPSRGIELLVEKESLLTSLIEEAQNLVEKKKKIVKNKKAIEKNLEIKESLKSYYFRESKVREALKESEEKILDESIEKGKCESILEGLREELVEYTELKAEYESYEYFLRAMSKDGIARSIISENLGLINREIEKILSQGVGFTIELEASENGKAIDIFFKHPSSKKRIIEICSGMEKTMTAIALRAALVNITTLPKSNIFVIDEAFDSLDPEYMAGLMSILEYLKQMFESVIIITHIDAFKDIVDHVVVIERDDDGYARVRE